MERKKTETKTPAILKFAQRPVPTKAFLIKKAKEVQLATNHFKVFLKKETEPWHIHSFQIFALDKDDNRIEIGNDARLLRFTIIKSMNEKLLEAYTKYNFLGNVLYAKNRYKENILVCESTILDKTYIGTFTFVKSLELTTETFADKPSATQALQVMNGLLKGHFKKEEYVPQHQNAVFYDKKKVIHIPEHQLQIYRGWKCTIEVKEHFQAMLKIDLSFRILRTQSLWDRWLEFR